MNHDIKFERVVRDCPANREAQADAELGEKVRLIYDFDVLINGERRAQLIKETFGARGYTLRDADRRAINLTNRWNSHLGEHVDNKAQFSDVINAALLANKIPTLEEMAAKREAEAEEKAAKRAKAIEERKLRIKAEHAADLFFYADMLLISPDDRGVRERAEGLLRKIRAEMDEAVTFLMSKDDGYFIR